MLIDRYVEVRDRRQALTPQEVAARQAIENMMGEHKLETYKTSDGERIAYLKASEVKAKVKFADDDASGGED